MDSYREERLLQRIETYKITIRGHLLPRIQELEYENDQLLIKVESLQNQITELKMQ